MSKTLLPTLLFFFGSPLSIPTLADGWCDRASGSPAAPASAPAPTTGGSKISSAPLSRPAAARRPAPAPTKFLFM